MPYIQIIQPEEAEGQLQEIYADLIKSRGKVADVYKIQSLNPPSLLAHLEIYMKIMFGKSPLRRYQREMMAVVVSNTNQCPYCITHHAEALKFFWKDEQRVAQLIEDYTQLDLSPTDLQLCQLAQKLTLQPNFEGKQALLDDLRSTGLEDRALLDATLVIAYFNFANRLVLGLGVELEADGGGGYHYE
ncbi:MAG: peroxidase-related enzyme [Bacteroidota bacterium]